MTPRRSIILAAHGAGDGSDANRRVAALASAVAEARPDVEAIAAFNLGRPGFGAALDATTTSVVTVVPLMTSDGYFVRERLPAALAEGARASVADVTSAPPVGLVRRLVAAVRERAVAEVAHATHPAAVIVVGHGTRRSTTSGDAARRLAREIADAAPQANVVVAFLDEPPLLEAVAVGLTERTVIVVPWLLGGGDHAGRDVHDRMASAQRPGRSIVVLPPLGDDAALLAAILALVDWHAPDRVFHIGTRSSRLAFRQTEIAQRAFERAGVRTTVTAFDTLGDREKRTPIDSFPTDGPFTDELEAALAAGTIDLAVHSLKDLPLVAGKDTCVAAVLPRGSAEEALVARRDAPPATLASLPHGARIGTCSRRRALQLRAVRPDLIAQPLRGTVDERLAIVDRAELDGAILAVAGLERLDAAERISERLPLDMMLPEPGQGAIAVTARVDDAPAIAVCALVQCRRTRAAVDAERLVAQAVEAQRGFGDRSRGGWIAAAFARHIGEELDLRARAIELETGTMREAHVRGPHVTAVVAAALAALGAEPWHEAVQGELLEVMS